MPASNLQEAIAVERALLQQIEASLHAHLQLEQEALAEVEAAWAPAIEEAAHANMDLPAYAAALAEHEEAQLACLAKAHAAEEQTTAENEHAYALAEAEAAAAGMDLETYVAVLTELETAELAQQGGDPDAATVQALGEQEAAAAGMDLPTYVAALNEAAAAQQSDEQAQFEALAYQEGFALHQAELAAQQAALAGMGGTGDLTPYDVAILQQYQLAQQQALALRLLR